MAMLHAIGLGSADDSLRAIVAPSYSREPSSLFVLSRVSDSRSSGLPMSPPTHRPSSHESSASERLRTTGGEMHSEIPASTPARRIAVVADDDDAIRGIIKRWLEELAFRVEEARDGEELVALARRVEGAYPALLVIDHHMPRMTGADALVLLRTEGCMSPAILVSGAPPTIAERLTAPSVSLPKPIQGVDFRRAVNHFVGLAPHRSA